MSRSIMLNRTLLPNPKISPSNRWVFPLTSSLFGASLMLFAAFSVIDFVAFFFQQRMRDQVEAKKRAHGTQFRLQTRCLLPAWGSDAHVCFTTKVDVCTCRRQGLCESVRARTCMTSGSLLMRWGRMPAGLSEGANQGRAEFGEVLLLDDCRRQESKELPSRCWSSCSNVTVVVLRPWLGSDDKQRKFFSRWEICCYFWLMVVRNLRNTWIRLMNFKS